jgi:N-6 DNA Methylase/HsdM N-terminal domain
VPVEARWAYLQAQAKQTDIGKTVDLAMESIEKENAKRLKGILPKVYGQQKLDQKSLGGLIDLIGSIKLGSAEAVAQDLLGQVYEYFLGQFALAEGKKGGQFYTPKVSSGYWWQFSNLIMGGYSILAVVRGECLSRVRSSSAITRGGWIISRFMGRRAMRLPINCVG